MSSHKALMSTTLYLYYTCYNNKLNSFCEDGLRVYVINVTDEAFNSTGTM